MTNGPIDANKLSERVQQALDAMDRALNPEGKTGPRVLQPGQKHDRGELMDIWKSTAFEEIACVSLPMIQRIIERLEAAESAARSVVEIAPWWGDPLEEAFRDPSRTWEYDDWRWHNERGIVRLLLEELRGLRFQLLDRCSSEFQREWRTSHKDVRMETGTFPITEARDRTGTMDIGEHRSRRLTLEERVSDPARGPNRRSGDWA